MALAEPAGVPSVESRVHQHWKECRNWPHAKFAQLILDEIADEEWREAVFDVVDDYVYHEQQVHKGRQTKKSVLRHLRKAHTGRPEVRLTGRRWSEYSAKTVTKLERLVDEPFKLHDGTEHFWGTASPEVLRTYRQDNVKMRDGIQVNIDLADLVLATIEETETASLEEALKVIKDG
jgi:hypothetical protein